MKVGEKSTQNQGGGGTNTDFNPHVYDILIPQGMDQVKILSNYDVSKNKRAIIPLINLKQR